MTDLEGPVPQKQRPAGPRPLGAFRRLDDILRVLPKTELEGLIRRLGIRVDPQKRIDVPAQVARALVGQPDVRDPSRLPPTSQEILRRLTEARGVLVVGALPAGFEPLMAKGIVFVRRVSEGFELVLPAAYLVQAPTWPSEDPRSLRALIAQAPFETVSAIASHYLARPATPPIALALEAAWEVLSDPTRLEQEIEALPLLERRLLEAIDGQGGEVETPELLDLEREPMRLRSAKGVTTTRRGAGFALERRALLIPVHPNRHVVPTEVAKVVGADRNRAQQARRALIRKEVLGEDHLPRRASFARDPAGISLALALAAREAASEVRAGIGTPRSLIVRLAQRFGRSTEAVSLLAALSRAIGLWEPGIGVAASPGSLQVSQLASSLFAAWRAGGAWDEARPEPEILRAAPDQREPSPARGLRAIVLDGLLELGVDGWVPYGSFERYVTEDPRAPGLERLLRRWADRVGVPEPPPLEAVVRRIVLETLPVLGVVDLGHDSRMGMPAVAATERHRLDTSGGGASPVDWSALRLTQRGRLLILDRPTDPPGRELSVKPTEFLDAHVLRVGGLALVGHVLAMAPFAEIGRVEDAMDLVLSPTAIARAVEGGAMGDEIRDRIEALAPLPASLSQILERASVVVGKGSLALASAFLWIEDPDVRELLRTRRTTAELFVDPSPPGGLLVQPSVDFERLVRRCRGLGIEIEVAPGETGLRAVRNLLSEASGRPPSSDAHPVGRALTPRPSLAVEVPSRSGTRAAPARPHAGPPPRSKTPFPRTR